MNASFRQKEMGAVIQCVKDKDLLYILPPCSFSNALIKAKVPSDSFVVLFIKRNPENTLEHKLSQEAPAINRKSGQFPHAEADALKYGESKILCCLKKVYRLAELLMVFFPLYFQIVAGPHPMSPQYFNWPYVPSMLGGVGVGQAHHIPPPHYMDPVSQNAKSHVCAGYNTYYW